MSLETFDNLVYNLRTEIEGGLIPQDLHWLRLKDPPEQLQFAPAVDLAKTILSPRLPELFLAVSNDGAHVDKDVSIALYKTEAFRILAILLCIQCSRDVLQKVRENIIRNYNSEFSISDKDLPITKEKAGNLFGDIGQAFYCKQYDFCPVILKEHEVVQCTGRATSPRLPFFKIEALGEGSSGDVVKAEVPPGHFEFHEESQGTNKIVEAFACKVFKTNNTKPYQQEFKILEFIRQSPRKHPNVMLARGSLLVQTTCVLYFDVAHSNLHDYFLNEPTIPRSAKDIKSFLWHFHAILDALAFLHEDLVEAENPSEVWRFAHLDLRPANILVFKESNGYDREIWKIHDFGISKVGRTTKSDEVIGWHKMFRSDLSDLTASGTLRARGSTTFLAPEYKNYTASEMASVTYKADIWSFGCIMSVGLSFLIGGSAGVNQFSEQRKKRAGVEDVFFVSEKRVRGMGKLGIHLNPAVSDYFKDVQHTDEHLKPIFRSIITFLKTETLAPAPKARVKAKEGAKRLHDILRKLDCSEADTDKSSAKNKIWKRITAADPTDTSKTFDLILPEGSNACKFSYCGKYLAYFSANAIAFCETVKIFRGDYKPAEGGEDVRLFMPPEKVTWRGFDINSKYLFAYTNEEYFDCYVYPHLTEDHYHFSIHGSSPIYYAVLSPDPASGLLAMALKSDDKKYYVYLSGVANMISMPMASTHLTPDLHSYQGSSTSTLHSRSGRRLSQTASSTSSNFQSLPHLPWENSLLQSAEVGERSELTHIHSMQFSADSTILTVLTQPPKANKLTWYCWDATSTGGTRIRIGKYNRDLEAKADAYQSWMTAFIPLTPEPSVMFVTQQNTIRRRAFVNANKSVDWSTQRLKIPIFYVLPFNRTKDKHFIFIGWKGGTVKALYAPDSKSQLYEKAEKIHFDFTLNLECDEWIAGRDAAAYIEDGMEFLIARPPNKGRQGFVRKVYRPRGPRPVKKK